MNQIFEDEKMQSYLQLVFMKQTGKIKERLHKKVGISFSDSFNSDAYSLKIEFLFTDKVIKDFGVNFRIFRDIDEINQHTEMVSIEELTKMILRKIYESIRFASESYQEWLEHYEKN